MPISRTNKIIVTIIIVAVIAVIGVIIYTYTPRGGISDQSGNPSSRSISLIYHNRIINISLEKLMSMNPYVGIGGYRTSTHEIKGIGNYTGVSITLPFNILFKLNISTGFGLNVSSADNWVLYDREDAKGNVLVYDLNLSNPNPIGRGGVEMVLVYAYNGQPLNSSDGYCRIGFLNHEYLKPPITDEILWLKNVQSIELIS